MRALRLSGLLALFMVASCGDEVTAPPLSEPATAESTTATSLNVPTPSSTAPTTPINEPTTTVSDRAGTQTTVSESSTPTIARPLSGPIVLRSGGLGDHDFGEPADDLLDELRERFGEPAEEYFFATDDAQGSLGPFWMANEVGSVTWDEPALHLVLSDLRFRGDGWDPPVPGSITLVSWATQSDWYVLDAGVGVGSSLAEFRRAYPQTEVGQFDFVCGISYSPARFRTGTDVVEVPRGWLDVRGELDWDWISEMQEALNERGGSLAVDGEYGPKTRAAVTELQSAERLDDGNGLIGPETAAALGLQAPDDAHVIHLEAGYPGDC